MTTKNLVTCVCGGTRFMNARSIAIDQLASGTKTRNWQSSPEDANVLQCANPSCAAMMVWNSKTEAYDVKQA